MMKMKLLNIGLEWEAANRLAEDRSAWNNFMELLCPMGILAHQFSMHDKLT